MELTKTQQMIAQQLGEDTGRHFLDSGGAYGRHWERNQGRNLFEEPHAVYSGRFSGQGYFDVVISTAHYLDARLDYTETSDLLTRLYQRWVDRDDFDRWNRERFSNSTVCVEDWVDSRNYLQRHREFESGGYTYNDENLLSQDFQWVLFEHKDDTYVAIATHNGCDARGGFSDVVIYELMGGDWEYWFDWGCASVSLGCDYRRPQIEQDQIDMFTGEVRGPNDPCSYYVDIRYGDVQLYDSNGHEHKLRDLVEVDNVNDLAYACPCGKGTLTVDGVDGPNYI